MTNTFLNPRQAADYLTNNLGLKTSFKTLAKLRCIGGSPLYHKAGSKRIIYKIDDLNKWAEAKISPAYHNTTEAARGL